VGWWGIRIEGRENKDSEARAWLGGGKEEFLFVSPLFVLQHDSFR
jgi:hypothetical protein